MADLTGTTPADTYKGLLQVNDYTDGVDATAKYIQDGEGTDSALAISTDKVGIGTTSPDGKLTLSTSSENTGVAYGNLADSLLIENTSDDAGAGPKLVFYNKPDEGSGTPSALIGLMRETATDASTTGDNKGNLVFWTRGEVNPEQRMIIDSDGNVGIGTDSPDAKLEIAEPEGSPQLLISNEATSFDSASIKFISGGTGNPASLIESGGTNTDRQGLFFSTGLSTGSVSFRMCIDSAGNVGIGTDSFGTDAAGGVIGIGNATAPTSSPADMVQLYAKDDAGSSRLYVRNEAGTETVLSPHAADAPSSLYDRPPGVEEMHRSANYYLGTIVFTNVDRRNALMQKQLNGEELPEDRTFTVTETFAEYNARTGADLQVEDWDANQQAMFDAQEEKVVARQAEIDAWDNEEKEAPEPLQSYVKKPKPDWLS